MALLLLQKLCPVTLFLTINEMTNLFLTINEMTNLFLTINEMTNLSAAGKRDEWVCYAYGKPI